MEISVSKPVVIEVLLSGQDLVDLSKDSTLLEKITITNLPISYRDDDMSVHISVRLT